MNLRTTIDAPDAEVADWPMLINGEWVQAAGGQRRDVFAPARGEQILARVPEASGIDLDRAVAAATAAFPAWKALHFRERGRLLLKIADRLEGEAESLAVLTAQDTGNALRTQARPESAGLVALFRYFGGVAGEFKGTVLPAGDDQLQYTRREPLGVVGAILPWNSPLLIAAMKLPAALAAGNTLVVKPAEDAPLTILRLAQIMSEFLPAGVLNVITGAGETTGQAMSAHAGIHKVSFTGSSEVGQIVGATAGGRLAHQSLELGGKNPNIVCPSAATPDLIDETATGVLTAMRFTRQGQSCTAGSRLFLHRDVHDQFLKVLARKAEALKVGDPLDEDTDMGTIINRTQYERVLSYIEDGKSQPGVHVVLDGSQRIPQGLDGYYQGPTIIAGASNDWRISREEIFGPVLVVIPWSDEAEVVAMANDSHYGLAAFVWSRDLDQALGLAHSIEAGWVQVNQGGGQVVGQSYGGYKSSGIGREFSIEGAIEGFTQLKQINVKVGR